jgi:HK97 family phage major capsid protein
VLRTQRLIDDSRFDIAQYVIDKLTGRFVRLEDAAFVSGTGVKQPKGFLSYPTSSAADGLRAAQTYQYIPSGAAAALTADGIINTFYSLRAP